MLTWMNWLGESMKQWLNLLVYKIYSKTNEKFRFSQHIRKQHVKHCRLWIYKNQKDVLAATCDITSDLAMKIKLLFVLTQVIFTWLNSFDCQKHFRTNIKQIQIYWYCLSIGLIQTDHIKNPFICWTCPIKQTKTC